MNNKAEALETSQLLPLKSGTWQQLRGCAQSPLLSLCCASHLWQWHPQDLWFLSRGWERSLWTAFLESGHILNSSCFGEWKLGWGGLRTPQKERMSLVGSLCVCLSLFEKPLPSTQLSLALFNGITPHMPSHSFQESEKQFPHTSIYNFLKNSPRFSSISLSPSEPPCLSTCTKSWLQRILSVWGGVKPGPCNPFVPPTLGFGKSEFPPAQEHSFAWATQCSHPSWG